MKYEFILSQFKLNLSIDYMKNIFDRQILKFSITKFIYQNF